MDLPFSNFMPIGYLCQILLLHYFLGKKKCQYADILTFLKCLKTCLFSPLLAAELEQVELVVAELEQDLFERYLEYRLQ
jgi:hypothetical protein